MPCFLFFFQYCGITLSVLHTPGDPAQGSRGDAGLGDDLIVGFALLFLGLSFMKESVPDLRQTPQVLEFVTQWSGYGFWSTLIFLGVGTVLTLILQSSSATMAITLIMLSMGWIPFQMGCAMVLGENIGTIVKEG